MGIFKAYDIRGRYPDELDEEKAFRIGFSFVRFLRAEKIVVGRDMRLSSPALSRALTDGARTAGAQVTDIGMVTSPLLYYAVIETGSPGGAMVTASHLPADMNGFKLCRELAIPLSRDHGLAEIEEMAGGAAVNTGRAAARGGYKTADLLESYIDRLSGFVRKPAPLRMVIDSGNGTAGPEISRLLERFPVWQAVCMHMEPDGSFPHHVANPLLPENTRDLSEKVRAERADIGIAFDGDADRCGFIDETGRKVNEDLVTALIAEVYLAREPGAKIIYDLRSSRAVAEAIVKMGGKPVRTRVGHSFIKEKMRQEGAVFAGELSGHYYYRDTGYTDNSLFTMIQMLNLLATGGPALSERMEALRRYSSTGEINLRSGRQGDVFAALEKAYGRYERDYLDGLTVSAGRWWFNLRASNTEPVVRLNLEASDPELMEEKKREVIGLIVQADPDAAAADSG
ncbi:MAG TPA: phosphomannomutase/phosphoglucomutase [Syntrophales bacterium]|nr:phosphomannomutase/phosphoglucomutase [Syntrophales bacterium]